MEKTFFPWVVLGMPAISMPFHLSFEEHLRAPVFLRGSFPARVFSLLYAGKGECIHVVSKNREKGFCYRLLFRGII